MDILVLFDLPEITKKKKGSISRFCITCLLQASSAGLVCMKSWGSIKALRCQVAFGVLVFLGRTSPLVQVPEADGPRH